MCEINLKFVGRVECVINNEITSTMDFPQPALGEDMYVVVAYFFLHGYE